MHKAVASRFSLTLNRHERPTFQQHTEIPAWAQSRGTVPAGQTTEHWPLLRLPGRFVTLTPGDIFLTGTPPGVGVFRKPPIYLKVISQVQLANGEVLISDHLSVLSLVLFFFQKGDVVECHIQHLGSIINKVV